MPASTEQVCCRRRYLCAFTLVEILVTTAILVVLVSILMPVLSKARVAARYTGWRSMSNSIQADPRVALYFDFDNQAADSVSARGEPIVSNKATGDPMAVVTSESTGRGAADPELRYGVLKESHPSDDTKGELPVLDIKAGRFPGKTAALFSGKQLKVGVDIDEDGTEFGPGTGTVEVDEGGYINTEHWAGICDGGEFQVAMWIRLQDTFAYQTPLSWGYVDSLSAKQDYFRISTTASTGARNLDISTETTGATKFDGHVTNYVDGNWHFLVVRLAAPFGTDGNLADPTVPEMDDIEVSIDGSPFKRPSEFWGDLDERRIETSVDDLIIGASSEGLGNIPTQRFIRGVIGEFAIWHEPTGNQELKRMYRTGAPEGHNSIPWRAAP